MNPAAFLTAGGRSKIILICGRFRIRIKVDELVEWSNSLIVEW